MAKENLDTVIACPPLITEKVRQFDEHLQTYTSGDYSEAQLRVDFINPMIKSLGWDVDNEERHAEAYRDVVYEDAIKVGGTTKAPDYGFYIGGRAAGGGRKFFLEAKKPSVPIRVDPKSAFQLRRYAYSAELPLSILTNFKEFIVYDTRFKPSAKDNARAAAVLKIKYTEYAERWHEIASVFSRGAILRGAFDKFAQGKRKKGMEPLGESFLKDIEGWRALLAHEIATKNDITVDDLNFAVQRTIDRILFLRICEDRGIEQAHNLMALLNGGKVYARLGQIFRGADDRYNSGIFHFPAAGKKPDPDRAEPPDDLTLDLAISDQPLKQIIRGLYDMPGLFTSYAFAVIPPEILGHVYEQFLGKVITLKANHRVKIEEKPEVRKAGGVYYTPVYIVDYIVKNTVGKLLEGKTPKDAEKVRVLDPASGSGSFLIGAYQYLLDWHLLWYLKNDPEKYRKGRNPALMRIHSPSLDEEPDAPRTKSNGSYDYRLTTAKRKAILLNSIYGVDIDPQAVEVTKLSLLLKVLEGESQESIAAQMKFLHQRALPDLGKNIKCGNSLIGDDFNDGDLSEEERNKINKFNWETAFAKVFKASGFDVVIGNPPYISMLLLDKLQPSVVKPYWKRKYASGTGAFDIYVLFVEQALSLLRDRGLAGFIIPNKFLAAEYARGFRQMILARSCFVSMLDLSRVKVWSASVYPVVPIFERTGVALDGHVSVNIATEPGLGDLRVLTPVPRRVLTELPDRIWSCLTQNGISILLKALRESTPLESIADVCGASTVAEGSEYPSLLTKENRQSRGHDYARFIVSGSVNRYAVSWHTDAVTFTHKTYMRPVIKLRAPMPERRIKQARSPKLIICKVALRPRVYPDIDGEYVGAYTTYILAAPELLKYLTGLLNSRLHAFLFSMLYDALAMGSGYLRFQPPQVRRLPIRTIDFSNKSDKAAHDRMVKLVDRMLDLHKKLAAAKSPHDKERITRDIEATDRQIDKLVYDLYGLTDEEIAIVETE